MKLVMVLTALFLTPIFSFASQETCITNRDLALKYAEKASALFDPDLTDISINLVSCKYNGKMEDDGADIYVILTGARKMTFEIGIANRVMNFSMEDRETIKPIN